MKKILNPAFILFAVIAFTACKKDNPVTNKPVTGSFSYKADGGATVIADSTQAVLYTLGVAPFSRMIDVYAFKGGKQTMEFHFQPKTGSVTADGTFTNAWLTYTTGINYPDDYYNSTSGTLNIAVCDTVAKKIEGTFNFTGNNGAANKAITEGAMKINITEIR